MQTLKTISILKICPHINSIIETYFLYFLHVRTLKSIYWRIAKFWRGVFGINQLHFCPIFIGYFP